MSDPRWAIQADPPFLLPGRSVALSLASDIHYVREVAGGTTAEL